MFDRLTWDVTDSYSNDELDQHPEELHEGQRAVPSIFQESRIPFALVG
jgi:hypothetical protein